MLSREGYTFCALKEGELLSSRERGVKPLLSLLDEGKRLEGFAAADKVVGRAAAFLYALLGADEVFAGTVSTPALEVFRSFGLPICFEREVEFIMNRTETGLCPMESSVLEISEPAEAERAIRAKLKMMKGE